MAKYPAEGLNKVNRYNQRAKYDEKLIHSIISECPILHISFNAPAQDALQFPTILPMLGAIDTYTRDNEPHIYVHGSNVARLFKLTSEGEAPLCVAATILDGYVLSLAPFHNDCNYRCAVVFGYGSVVEDPEEVLWAMRLITNDTMPHRWENSRHPPSRSEITATGILKIRIETASAKIRTGGSSDEKSDLRDAELCEKTWVGVVPTYQTLGEPIEHSNNKVKILPEYLADWVADANSMSEQRAVDAAEA